VGARLRTVLLAMSVVAAGTILLVAIEEGGTAIRRAHAGRRRSPLAPALRRRTVVLGRSARGRPIRAVELGDPRLPTALLVVGCIHGNECAGRRVAQLIEARPPAAEHVWVIDDLNPDGFAAGRRVNGQGVDLNRDFPWHWRPLPRSGGQYSGPRALYAPEDRIAERLILSARPRVTVWFHQPLDLVDESGGNPAVARRFGRLARMRVTRLPRYPGSAAGWQDHRLPGTTAFVVELPGGHLAGSLARRLAAALRHTTPR
jgi:murein peptide amidase A